MTLRLRIAASAAGAVALAVLGLAVVIYVAVRSDLRGEVDRVLRQQAQPLLGGIGFGVQVQAAGAPPPIPGAPLPPKSTAKVLRSGPPQPFTGAGGYLQLVAPGGGVVRSAGESGAQSIPPTQRALAIAASGHGEQLTDVNVGGQHMRVLTIALPQGGAAQLARPLTEVDHELSSLVVLLALLGAGGIAVAALAGGLVARTALAPIARFTRRTEQLAGEPDARARLEAHGNDELARLAQSFNVTLDALERSVAAQRHLVADASHELRTPIASLRANIQVLDQAASLPAADLEGLRRDVIGELDELTALVADLVELARGTEPPIELDDVRVDELTRAAVARAQRHANGRSFAVDLAPTLVVGDAMRIDRAISNLLENAVKWSPPDGVIEVGLSAGVLSVRDHGPGFGEQDLENVFERFYRANGARGMPGSGLGLAIVKQAAEAHGGHVEAVNAPGGGARVSASFGAPQEFLRSS